MFSALGFKPEVYLILYLITFANYKRKFDPSIFLISLFLFCNLDLYCVSQSNPKELRRVIFCLFLYLEQMDLRDEWIKYIPTPY